MREDGAPKAVTEFASTIDALARRIEDALDVDQQATADDADAPVAA